MYRIKSLYGNKLRVEAISGATGESLAMLEEQAKELGRTTSFSAKMYGTLLRN